MKIKLTQEYLKDILDYNHFNGEFHWIKRRKGVQIYSVAGYTHKTGYRRINIDGKQYQAHRLAFLYITGSFPLKKVYHFNNRRDDNRWLNLRQTPIQKSGGL